MSDIIRLLPDSVANQIAAGEVIQRPASAVKELLENAVDAGAGHIELIVKDAGKTLLQVIDNGCGMSATDARMSFERHATSKIKEAADLFRIHTLGFRGEALASIAAIAQVEVKTRRVEDELGTHLVIEGSVVKSQQPCACPAGTSFLIKNLFFNVPARRNFLKSDAAEMRHILEEFQRVALVNPGIAFSCQSNGKVLFQLPAANLKQRIINLMGSGFQEKLLPVNQDSNVVKISGYAGKPESAKKTKGEQYFFANNRFIRHPYLNHAVEDAFSDLLPEGYFPSYFIYLDVDPSKIDINIHPTKTEVNFLDHQVIYSMLRSAVRQAIGKFSFSSTLDFEAEKSFDTYFPKDRPVVAPGIHINPEYNPFVKKQQAELKLTAPLQPTQGNNDWEKLYNVTRNIYPSDQSGNKSLTIDADFDSESVSKGFMQFQNKYIVSRVKSGLMIIDQQAAHERVLYERMLERIEQQKASSQQQLFPQTVNLSAPDAELIKELLEEFSLFGFQMEHFGQNSYIIRGIPADLVDENIQTLIENVLENFKNNQLGLKVDKKNNLTRAMARNMAVKPGKVLMPEEMQSLVDDLFSCQVPNVSPSGKTIIITIQSDEIEKRFGN
ncbi:DNA mismatch repair protein MutL [bioreactor metagenome]|jgi:DNA mismatch repair protein MutL|uniref:DNA mismatch repair protein MutL n=1 Tax=bioreactor metagenome TaxID=1076179 RepID=A0A644TYU7_9ZZZZ|nr:DNA mismatch repair endonuclease MutL [Lentimicrobium sp.]MEA5110937.1 DNA mismatch repair endonuclease MutL [Lentimicrobium sp.]